MTNPVASDSAQDRAIVEADLHDSLVALAAQNASTHELLAHMISILAGIRHMLAEEYEQNEINTFAVLNTSELVLDRKGRRFLAIYTPVSVASCTMNVMGMGPQTFNLTAGWNVLNAPDRSILVGPSGSSQPILIKATNWVQASAI